MKRIRLNNGLFALIDDTDFAELSLYHWWSAWSVNAQQFYAVRRIYISRKKFITIPMHRQLLGLISGDPLQGDHIDGNGLNNRRSNLRIATRSQQKMNSKVYKSNSTGIKGVSWNLHHKAYSAYIYAYKVRRHLGYFKNLTDAKTARRRAEVTFHGEYARGSR